MMVHTPGRAGRVLVTVGVVLGVLGTAPVGGDAEAGPAEPTYAYSVNVIGVGTQPNAVAVDPGTHTAYVTDYHENTVSVIDEISETVTATISLGFPSEPSAVAVDPGTHTVYVVNSGTDSVSVIDEASNTITGAIPIGGLDPAGVAVDPGTHTAYVTDLADGTVYVLDETTETVTARIRSGGREAFAVAVDPGTHTVYVTGSDNAISVIDGTSHAVTATIGVSDPGRVAIDPGTHTAYVTDYDENTLSVIDEATNTVIDTIGVGHNPYAVAADASTHTAYVADSLDDNSVSVIDETTTTVTATIGVGEHPYAMAVDPGMHTVYVTNYLDATVSVITQHPVPAPPSVISVDPRSGPTTGDQTVTITGSGFTGATRVMFGRTPAAAFTVDSDTRITAITPAHTAGSVRVRVSTTALSPKTPGARYKFR